MKILIASLRGPTNADRKGGAQEYILKLAEECVLRGHEILIICGEEKYKNGYLPATETVNGVNVKRVKGIKGIRAYVATQHEYYDVVIENVMAVAMGLPKLLPKQKPFLALRHHLQGKNFFNLQGPVKGFFGLFMEAITEPLLYRNVQWIAASDLTASFIEKRWLKPQKKVIVASPGFNFIAANVDKTEAPSIFFIGYLNIARKKVDDLIAAFKLVQAKVANAQLYIAGDGPDKHLLQKMSEGLPVTFLGFLTEPEKHTWYERCWIFASPSVSEGFGITWIEAGAHATPMVGYELGLKTVNADCSIMVEPLNVNMLADAAISLLTNEKLRLQMGVNAKKNAAKYSWQQTADTFLDTIERL